MRTWGGQAQNVPAAQDVLAHRARCNSAAREGRYAPELEQGSRGLVRAGRV
jgi:fructose-bisphosphate aldolase class I